jgi:hypothetical protein
MLGRVGEREDWLIRDWGLGVELDRAAIAKIENGLRGVLDYELAAIACALGVRVRRLLAG